MKRVVFGVIWFIVFFIVLYFIFGVAMGVTMSHSMGDMSHMSFQQRMDAGKAFAQVHAGSMAAWRMIILIVSIVLAVAGAVTGFLPGTRKKKVATPAQ